MAEMVTLKLAHPLPAKRAEQARAAAVKDYEVGDEIKLPPHEAHALIGAGYAQGVDPQDPEAVREALKPRSSGRPAAERAAAGEQKPGKSS